MKTLTLTALLCILSSALHGQTDTKLQESVGKFWKAFEQFLRTGQEKELMTYVSKDCVVVVDRPGLKENKKEALGLKAYIAERQQGAKTEGIARIEVYRSDERLQYSPGENYGAASAKFKELFWYKDSPDIKGPGSYEFNVTVQFTFKDGAFRAFFLNETVPLD